MANRIRGREGSEAVLTFRLPRSLHDKLKLAAAGRSVSEEMRERLEASFQEPADPETRNLLAAISAIVDFFSPRSEPASGAIAIIPSSLGHWRKDVQSCAAMETAIQAIFSGLRPREVGKDHRTADHRTAGALKGLAALAAGVALAKLPDPAARAIVAQAVAADGEMTSAEERKS